jgi:hypothetical protein
MVGVVHEIAFRPASDAVERDRRTIVRDGSSVVVDMAVDRLVFRRDEVVQISPLKLHAALPDVVYGASVHAAGPAALKTDCPSSRMPDD